MTVRALCYLVVLVPTLCARGESVLDGYAIMPQSEGPALMRQCSRFAPTHISGFWTPSVPQVQAIEQRLVELLRRSGHHIKLVDSRRQYIGVITRGKRLIPQTTLTGERPRSLLATEAMFSGEFSLTRLRTILRT